MKLRLTLENANELPADAGASIDFGERQKLTIGRAAGQDWTLPDPRRLMSGSHCEIRRLADGYLLYDLSSNGTFVAGSKTRLVSPHPLQDGELLLLGSCRLRVHLEAEVAASTDDDRTRIVKAPAVEPRLQLTITDRPDLAGQPVLTANLGSSGALVIGRDDSADWTLPEPSEGISRRHCTIRFLDGSFVLEDSSANGSFLNGSGERVSGRCPLHDGDLLAIGAHLIAVGIRGLAPSRRPGEAAPAVAAAPRSPRRGGDPAAMIDELPAAPAVGGARPVAADDGVTRLAPVVNGKPAPAPAEAPPGAVQADAALPTPAAAEISEHQRSGDARVLAAIARGLRLAPEDLEANDAAVLGERLGELIYLLSDEIRQLLAQRDAALGRGLPGGSATGHFNTPNPPSNPLALLPTSEEALRVLFGPPRRAYLAADESFRTSLHELGEYLLNSDAALRAAVQVLTGELSPAAIEQAVSSENLLGQLLSSRKSRLWDLYVERWNSRAPLQAEQPVASFLRTFSAAAAHPHPPPPAAD